MIYQIHGCSVEMSSGMQTAKVRRLEIRGPSPVLDADGKSVGEVVLQSAAEAEFHTKVVGEGEKAVTIHAQEQAHLWARALPDVVEDDATDLDEAAE